MNLKYLEACALGLAAVFGVFWYINPDGSFEALSFITILLGVTVTDYVRRMKQHKKIMDSNEILVQELSRRIEARLSELVRNLDSSTQESIKEEMSKFLPNNLRDAIMLLAGKSVNSLESPITSRLPQNQHSMKSLSEAYGIECSAYEFGDMSIYEAKGNRAKSQKRITKSSKKDATSSAS